MQTVIVGVLIVLSVIYLIKISIKTLNKKGKGGCSSCSKE